MSDWIRNLGDFWLAFGHLEFSAKRRMDFELRLTDKGITAWGAMALMKRMLDRLRRKSLRQHNVPALQP